MKIVSSRSERRGCQETSLSLLVSFASLSWGVALLDAQLRFPNNTFQLFSFFLSYEFSKLPTLGSSLLPKLNVVSLSYNQVSRIFSALYRVRTKELSRKDVLAAILNSILFGSRYFGIPKV